MTVVALLRGINVGGHKTIGMADLRQLFTSIGCADVRSLLNSGNFVFENRSTPPARVEARLEAAIRKRFAMDIAVLARSADEWRQVVARNPFVDEAERDPARLAVLFVKEPVPAARVKTLQASIVGREVVRGNGREAYIVYPDGMGRSKLTLVAIEKVLGVRGTARNWNTVLKLKELACE